MQKVKGQISIMRKFSYAFLMTFAMALALLIPCSAQTKKTITTSPAPVASVPSPLAALPASDAVMFIDAKRLFTDAMPRALASDSTRLAQVNADIEDFKKRTGIDARSFDRIAVGVRYTNPSTGITKLEPVAIAQGTFNPGALVAAGRLAAKGAYQEQQYGGKTIYTFNLNDQIKVFGLLKLRVSELAAAALDANTLAVGEPARVREAIDVRGGRAGVSPDITSLATHTPNAIIGFGGNVPASAVQRLDFGNEEISRSIGSIRQLYGSLGTTPNGFNMLAVLRTGNPTDARNLNDTIAAVRQFAPVLLAQLSGDKGKLAQNAINSLKVSAQGNEVQLGLELPQADITTLLRIL